MGLKQMEPATVNVGDNRFYITPFSAFKAANLTGELASVLAPLFGVLAPFMNKDVDLGTTDVAELAPALSGLTALDSDRLESLMRKLLLSGNVVVELTDDNGKTDGERLTADIADELFCGSVQDMFVLCLQVIKQNFSGFFKKLAVQYGAQEAAAPRKIL